MIMGQEWGNLRGAGTFLAEDTAQAKTLGTKQPGLGDKATLYG